MHIVRDDGRRRIADEDRAVTRDDHADGRGRRANGGFAAELAPRPEPRRATIRMACADRPLEILVVDDESELREQLRRLFSREGHQRHGVAGGRDAIDRASTAASTSCCSTSRSGPGPTATRSAATLRARRNVVPIIMLTALDSEADAVLGLEAGADDYVTKPFGPAELRSRIRAVLRRAGTRALGDEVLAVGPLAARPRHARGQGRRPPGRAHVLGVRAAAGADGAARASCSTARSCCARSGATAHTAIRAASTCTSATCARSSSAGRSSRSC